ncbi:GNAT family N-acetyltransferase [Mesorhizobium sp. ANAO-SY3R2]|uniref:GNAT family N-acetyltransferase n=1 Tax=Mesorhizobium sp. ANAO-SY3R2 TaxID=3166644 RepID=UPI00366EBA59
MVDTTGWRRNSTTPRPTVDSASTATAFHASKETIAAYGEFSRLAVFAPAQSPKWVSGWLEATGSDAVVAMLTVQGRVVLALALEVCQEGPFRIARFLSGKHANGNFPASDKKWLATADAADVQKLIGAIKAARRDIDAVVLERLIGDFDGLPNPLLTLPSAPSPNIALAVDLDGGFEAVLGRTPGKKKRKRHRSQERKYDAVGGARRVVATTEAETNAMLDAFFAMKKQRFAAMGITDVFAPAEVRSFFRRLFADALKQDEPAFVLHGLEADGRYRAVTGSSRAGSRLICEFGAIMDDDLAYISPGEYLFFDNISEACEQGFGIYDFSVGDEPYKRNWCDLEIRHADVLVPLSAKGRIYALGIKASSRIKAAIKGNHALWALVRRLRTGARGKAALAGED